MPANGGIARFTVSKSMKYSGYFSPPNTCRSSGLNHGSPVCTHVSRTPLNLSQLEVVRYVANGLDAHLLQFFHRAARGYEAGSRYGHRGAADCIGQRTRR